MNSKAVHTRDVLAPLDWLYTMFVRHTDMPRKVRARRSIRTLVALGAVVASTFVLVGCGEGASQPTQAESAQADSAQADSAQADSARADSAQADSAKVELESAKNSGVSGTATFLKITAGVEVKLAVRNLPKPDTIYLAHIHSGSCGEEVQEQGNADEHEDEHESGEIEYPLSPVKSDSEGRASSSTTLWDTTMAKLFSGEPKYVNVHASGQGIPSPLACANLRDAN